MAKGVKKAAANTSTAATKINVKSKKFWIIFSICLVVFIVFLGAPAFNIFSTIFNFFGKIMNFFAKVFAKLGEWFNWFGLGGV